MAAGSATPPVSEIGTRSRSAGVAVVRTGGPPGTGGGTLPSANWTT